MKKRINAASGISFFIYAATAIITPICILEIGKTFSTNLTAGGGIETARTLILFLVLLISGALAHKWGKKALLSFGLYCMAGALFLFLFVTSYFQVLFLMLIIGFGGGFIEALVNPLIQEIHQEEGGKYLNLINSFYSIGVMVMVLVYGELLSRGVPWRALYAITGSGCLAAALLFQTAPFPKEHSDIHFLSEFRSIMKLKKFWLFAAAIFFGASVESAFSFWSAGFIQLYHSELPRAGAIGVAVFAGMMATGRLLSSRWEKLIGLNSVMMISAGIGIIVSFFIRYSESLYAVYLFLGAAGLSAACFWPSILAEAGRKMKADTTILFVLLACIGIAGFGFAPFIMGMIGDAAGLKTAFLTMPGLFTVLLILLIFERRIEA